jgi:hypothetical protein
VEPSDFDTREEYEVALVILDHFARSRGKSLAVPDADVVARMIVGRLNGIDDLIESGHWLMVGGVDTKQEARAVHTAGQNLWRKVLQAGKRR